MKILVAVASKHGASMEIGDAISRSLQSAGLEASLMRPEEVERLDGLDAVVLGSAVYAGHWMKQAVEMAERLSDGLRRRPVWLFSSGPVGDPPRPEDEPVDVTKVTEWAGARAHQVFNGKLDRAKLGFGEKAIVAAFHAPYGDFSDWDAIAAWAAGIASDLTQPAQTQPAQPVGELSPAEPKSDGALP